jgi:hypothetical protein
MRKSAMEPWTNTSGVPEPSVVKVRMAPGKGMVRALGICGERGS